jgi:hypothetical protein
VSRQESQEINNSFREGALVKEDALSLEYLFINHSLDKPDQSSVKTPTYRSPIDYNNNKGSSAYDHAVHANDANMPLCHIYDNMKTCSELELEKKKKGW